MEPPESKMEENGRDNRHEGQADDNQTKKPSGQ